MSKLDGLDKIEQSLNDFSKKSAQLGKALTFGLTLPIVGLFIWGFWGLVIGGLLGICCLAGMSSAK